MNAPLLGIFLRIESEIFQLFRRLCYSLSHFMSLCSAESPQAFEKSAI